MSAGGDMVRNFGGGGWTEKYGEMIYLLRNYVEFSSVPVLWGRVDSRVNDDPPQAPAWHRAKD